MTTPKILLEGLTYDDVLLVPAYSEVLPREVNIQTKFTRNITINSPIISAAMDTVTESKMAIAMAQEGGIGVLHKNMSIEMQANEVKKVKRSESGMILEPITIKKDGTVFDAKSIMREYGIGGIPVIDDSEKLIGIITNRDLRFEGDNMRKIEEVMTSENLVTVAVGTSLKQAELILQHNKIEKLPVVNAYYKLVGLITYRDIIKVIENPSAKKDEFGRLRVAAAIGVTGDAFERAEALIKAGNRLASDKTWWGDTDADTDERNVISCQPSGNGKWKVRVRDAVGSVAIKDLKITATPESPQRHIIHRISKDK